MSEMPRRRRGLQGHERGVDSEAGQGRDVGQDEVGRGLPVAVQHTGVVLEHGRAPTPLRLRKSSASGARSTCRVSMGMGPLPNEEAAW